MSPSSNKSVSSASSNSKKHKKKMKKRDKHSDKKEAAADQHHQKKRKHREHKEPKESRRSSSGKSKSKRYRFFGGPHVYWFVLAVVSVVLSSVGVCYYKKTTQSPMPPPGVPVPGTNAPSTCSEGQQERPLLTQLRQKPINLRPFFRGLAHRFQRILTRVIESPVFPETRATRLRSRALQEMRLNDEPLQDDPPYHSFPGYAPRPRVRAAAGKHLQAQREQHRAALRAIEPLMLNGQEQVPAVSQTAPFHFFGGSSTNNGD